VTPYISGLVGGAAIDGLISSVTLPTLSNEPGNALIAIERIDVHSSASNVLGVQYNGYDLLLIVNLTNVNLATPELGVITSGASGYLADLQTGGAVAAAVNLTSLNAHAVWAVLVPDQNFAVNAQIGNLADPTSLAGEVTDKAIANGGIVYLTSQNNPLLTPPNISGFNTEAVSPDGNQVYAIDTAQNALVVVNTADLSQRQLFEDGFNGVTGLQGATGVAISPDGGYVYVSGSQGITVFQRNTATGDLTLMSSLGTSVANLQSHIVAGQGVQGTNVFSTVAVSTDGSSVYVAGTDGIVRYSWSTGAGLTFQASAGTPEGVSQVSMIEHSPSTAAAYSNDLFAVSRSGDTLYLLDATTLNPVASLSGATQQGLALTGASNVAISSDGQTVFVAGQDSDAISIFQRGMSNGTATLVLVQTLQDGIGGVRGLAGPNSLALSPDGRYLMASSALGNDVAVFAVNANTKQWQFVQVVRNSNGGVTGLFAPDALVTVNGPGGAFTYVADLGDANDLGGITKFSIAGALPPPISDVTTFANIGGLSVNTQGNDDTVTLAAAGPPPINPATSIDNAAHTIDFGIPDNLTTGDALTYSANGGTAINGLVDGQVY
jgi:WD40 repeat protein